MTLLRTDYHRLPSGACITLYPHEANPLHQRPVTAVYINGYFYCDGDPRQGPDYYWGDVSKYHRGFRVVTDTTA